MVIQINVKNPDKIKKGDILIYDGEKFDIITQEDILRDIKKDIEKIKNDVQITIDSTNKARENIKNRQYRFVKAFLKGK